MTMASITFRSSRVRTQDTGIAEMRGTPIRLRNHLRPVHRDVDHRGRGMSQRADADHTPPPRAARGQLG
jgi:hypothetical protein